MSLLSDEKPEALQDNHRDCNLVNCEGTAQHMWDKAVAYYAGSKWESDTEAVLLDALANRLCRVFGTCSDDGLSMVSQKIFRHFQDGQTALKQAECSNLVSEKNGITSQLYVPLIQDLLRVAHALATERDIRRDRSQGIFFAKILQPKLATCDQAAADLVARNMLARCPVVQSRMRERRPACFFPFLPADQRWVRWQVLSSQCGTDLPRPLGSVCCGVDADRRLRRLHGVSIKPCAGEASSRADLHLPGPAVLRP